MALSFLIPYECRGTGSVFQRPQTVAVPLLLRMRLPDSLPPLPSSQVARSSHVDRRSYWLRCRGDAQCVCTGWTSWSWAVTVVWIPTAVQPGTQPADMSLLCRPIEDVRWPVNSLCLFVTWGKVRNSCPDLVLPPAPFHQCPAKGARNVWGVPCALHSHVTATRA